MNCLKPLLWAAIIAAASLSAQIPQELVKAERGKILEGVKTVPRTGAPGPVAIWGQMAFPLLAARNREGVELAVAAAAGYGKGRIILFGHNSYLDGGAGGDHARLMANCARWVSAKEKPKVGVIGKGTQFYEGQGFRAETLEGPVSAKTLAGIDVVVINMQSHTDAEEGAALAEWIRNGGGFIGGMTGWAFSQTSGGKDLAVAHGLNQALMPAGVAITDMSAFDQLPGFEGRLDLPPLMNASSAIVAIKKQTSGGALTAEEVKQGSNAIQIALAAQPPGRGNLRDAVMAALGAAGGENAVPTKEAPLTQATHAAARIRLGMETRMLRVAGAGKTVAHPAHESFPGRTRADAPRISSEVQVNPAVPGWTSTGLYAPAGEAITVTLPAAVADQGYAVRIGCHSDTLYHLDEWRRAPDITKSVALTAAETEAASAFGGLIYIEVPARAAETQSFTVGIKGAVASPYFLLGRDDDAAWNAEIKKRPGPWAELACDKMILSLPAEVAQSITNPTMLMEFWKKVVEAQDDISNQAGERRRPERIVPDVQISAGFMHSGYPIMIHLPEAVEMVTLNRIKFPGWGFYHEIGHNHQRGDFTFDGAGEVTNNVIGMYCYHAVLNKDPLQGHPAISEEARREHIRKIKAASDKWALWKSEPFVALTPYIQLVQEFGWESWRQYLHSFADGSFGPAPKTDDEKRDQFLVRYSKITKRNLGPFFDAWGIPVNAAAKAEAAKWEPWLPKGM
jgi:hypothetical protein